jgi:hypothetical protein
LAFSGYRLVGGHFGLGIFFWCSRFLPMRNLHEADVPACARKGHGCVWLRRSAELNLQLVLSCRIIPQCMFTLVFLEAIIYEEKAFGW